MHKKKDGFLIWNIFWRLCVYASILVYFLYLKQDNHKGIEVLSAIPHIVIVGAILVFMAITVLLDYFSNKPVKSTFLIVADLVMGVFLICTSPSFITGLCFTLPVMVAFRFDKIAGSWVTFVVIGLYMFLGVILSLVLKQVAPFLVLPDLLIMLALVAFAFFSGDQYAFLRSQEERTKALISLIQVSQELGVSSSLQQVLTTGLNVVKALFPCHSCVIYLKSDDDPKESIVRVKAYSSKIPEAFIDFNPDITASVVGKTIKDRADQLIGNYSNDPREDVIPKDKGLRSMMISPLRFEDKAVGAMLVVHSCPDYYIEDDLKLFSMLSAQIGLAIRNIQIQETMGTMAITDSLSGLFTHGYFQENLSELITKAKYDNKPISVMIIDVDFFKKINDTYGHPQGDALLKQLGGVLRSIARKSDVLCRYGGDEFTVTMPDTNRISAVILAEKIRTAVEEYEFVVKGQVAHITISGGVASFPEDAQTKKELIDSSDKAMYQSKQAGRNKISFGASKK